MGSPRWWFLFATIALLVVAKPCTAQIGPGDGFPDAGDAPSIGEDSQPFVDDPDAGDAPSIGEDSNELGDDPDAGDAPSIGEEPIPGEGPPDGRIEPFGGE
ncbi:MAG: hypothetical protein FJ144_17505 [Deltaproteobacteria bacterium]|nr:hypothetical protein [Deltaproteobacteria bacterium]